MQATKQQTPKLSAAEQAKKAALEAELALILSSGVPKEQVKIEDVFVTDTDTIHTIQVGPDRVTTKDKNNVVLMLHGYGAPASCYFRLLPHLAKDFHLVLIDLPGMNFSSRTKDRPFDSLATCLAFCLDRIEALVFALKLDFFSLVGHSIGGFLGGHLFQRLHERILRVVFLSPAGVNPPEPDQLGAVLKKQAGKNIFKRLFISNFLHFVFDKKNPPFQYFRIGPLKRVMVHFYVSNKRFEFSDFERQKFKAVANFNLAQPPCGEYMVCYLMHFGPKSKAPLIDLLEKMPERFHDLLLVYGETDVLDHHLVKERFAARGMDIQIKYLAKADHQLIFQNVAALGAMIRDHLVKDPKQAAPAGPAQPCSVECHDTLKQTTSLDDRVYELLEEESVNGPSRPLTPKNELVAPLTKEEEDELQSEALDEAARVTDNLIL